MVVAVLATEIATLSKVAILLSYYQMQILSVVLKYGTVEPLNGLSDEPTNIGNNLIPNKRMICLLRSLVVTPQKKKKKM